jgi:ATP/maltotriose-dependent transcriptional regulator MalT/two-component SAPR family response regulator
MDALLRHAITPPVFSAGKLHRERLVDMIHANIPRKLIVVAAPPGYGKTTLAADFTQHTELPVCWVRMTEADQDVMRMARVLAASLAKRFRRLRGYLEIDKMVGSEPEGLARVFAEVIELMIGEPFVILIDEVHLANRSRGVLRFLDTFLEVQPEQATLIVIGREVPDISLAKLMAEGDLAGIGPHDLALDQTELQQIALDQFTVKLGEAEAGELLNETRGWVTGVLLSGQLTGGLMQGWLDGSRPMVYEYLASVVLNRQPDDIRRFMLDSSVMPVMTVASCNAVLEREDSERYLRRLVAGGMFVTTTSESPRTYEYHPQFREFLIDVLGGSDDRRMGRLRRRAADYLAEQGLVEHAVDLYIEAGSISKAASMAERHAREMYIEGRFETLETWARRMEELDVVAPRVSLYLATLYSNQGKQDVASEKLEDAQSALKTTTSKSIKAHTDIVRSMIAFYRSDYEETIMLAKRALSMLTTRGDKSLRAMGVRFAGLALLKGKGELIEAEEQFTKAVQLLEGGEDQHALAIALIDLSGAQSILGKSVEGNVNTQRAHDILLEIGSPLPLASSFNNMAMDAHWLGRFQEALNLYGEALKNARLAGAPLREALNLYGQADIYNDLGLSLQAAELYAQGLTIATGLESEDWIRYGCIQTSVLHRRRGGNTLGMEWLKRAVEYTRAKKETVSIQIQMAALETAGSPVAAYKRLRTIVDESTGKIDAADITSARFFMAIARKEDGDDQAALEEFTQCIAWAGGHGTEQIVASELLCRPEFLKAVKGSLEGDPVFSIVEQRIETMKTLAEVYREPSVESVGEVEFELIALGDAGMLRNGEPVEEMTPFARELLFYLADRKRVERDTVIETFWPDSPPGRQTSNLHTAVYSLRRAIGKGTILSDGSVYSMDPDFSIEYDVTRFENTAEVAEALPPGDPRKLFALTEAINLYSGPYLPEFSSNWVTERRRMLEMRYLDLTASYADEALLRDQPLRAVTALREALKMDPTRDDLNLRILEVLGRLGRRSEIVSHYQRYVRLLADELGLDPPEALRDTYSRLIG